MEAPVGQAKPPLTQAEKAKQSIERMKTETIHAQAMTLNHLRNRIDELEQLNRSLIEANHSLKLKLTSANKVVVQLKGNEHGS